MTVEYAELNNNSIVPNVYFRFCSRGGKHLVPKFKGGGGILNTGKANSLGGRGGKSTPCPHEINPGTCANKALYLVHVCLYLGNYE